MEATIIDTNYITAVLARCRSYAIAMAPPMVYLYADYDSFSSLRISRPATLVLVPYAYPAYERQQRKAVHTSNSFAFVVLINEMPFLNAVVTVPNG